MATTETSSTLPLREQALAAQPARWRAATRIGFRFCVLYFGLFLVAGQMLTSLIFAATNDGGAFEVDYTRPVVGAVRWVGAHVLRIGHPISAALTGSGDRQFDWIELGCILFLAVAGTAVWSVWDRRRTSYPTLFRWAHLVARLGVGTTFLAYGAAKVYPLQMPFPQLWRLVEPYGHFSTMGVLWYSIGASPHYEMFAGSAELLAGVLLLFPRTATVGALVALADATQVFMLNMTYDVPVKILSFHLILLSLFVLAPDLRRLYDTLVLGRAAGAQPERTVFRSGRARRWAAVAVGLFAVYQIGSNVRSSSQAWAATSAMKSPLYGIWKVAEFSQDGMARPPLETDTARWKYLIFDASPRQMRMQDMNDELHVYAVQIDTAAHTIAVGGKPGLSYSQPAPGTMLVAGELEGHKVQARLALVDRNSFLLVTRGFHWIQERSYNR